MKGFFRRFRRRSTGKRQPVLGQPERLESRIALTISPFEAYALLIINKMRADPAKFGAELRNLHNNRNFVSTHGMRGDDPIWTDLRNSIREAEGRTTAAGIKWYSGFNGRGGETFLSVISALPRTGPLVMNIQEDHGAGLHNNWMLENGFAHTGDRATSSVDGLGFNPNATPDTYVPNPPDPLYHPFLLRQSENIGYGYQLNSLPATEAAWRQGKLTWEGFFQRYVYADTLGFMLEKDNASTTDPWGHLLNMAGYSPDLQPATSIGGSGSKSLGTINAAGIAFNYKNTGSRVTWTTHRFSHDPTRSYIGFVTYRDLNKNNFYDVGEGINVNFETTTYTVYRSSPDSEWVTSGGGMMIGTVGGSVDLSWGPSPDYTGFNFLEIAKASPTGPILSESLAFEGFSRPGGQLARIPKQTVTYQPRNRFFEYRVSPSGQVSPGGGFGLVEEEATVERVESNEVFLPCGVTIGSVEFGSDGAGYAVRSGGQVIPVKVQGESASPSYPGGGWLGLGARQSGSGYEVVWWNQQLDAFGAWTLDASGGMTGSRMLSRNEMFALESQSAVDLTWDGFVGTPPAIFTPWAVAQGGVELGTSAAGYALRVGGEGGQVVTVTFGGGAASDSRPGAGWMAMAARQSGGGYELFWRNADAGLFGSWTLSGSGALAGSQMLSLAQVQAIESQVNLDITGDGNVGVVFTSQRTIGAVEFGTIAAGYAVRAAGQVIPVTYGGVAASDAKPGAGWVAVAARQSGSGYELFWRNTQAGLYGSWTLSGSGALVGSQMLSLAQVQAIESQVNLDLTGDGQIGVVFTSQVTIGAVEFGTIAAGYAVRAAGQVIPVTYGGVVASDAKPGAGWVAVAARQSGSGYELFWRNTQAGAYGSWTLSGSGALVGSQMLSLPRMQVIEWQVGLDLTGEGRVGFPVAAFAALYQVGTVEFGTTGQGYAIRVDGASGQVIPVMYAGGNASSSRPGGDWEAVAARRSESGYEVLWVNWTSEDYGVWSLADTGEFVSARRLTLDEALDLFPDPV